MKLIKIKPYACFIDKKQKWNVEKCKHLFELQVATNCKDKTNANAC